MSFLIEKLNKIFDLITNNNLNKDTLNDVKIIKSNNYKFNMIFLNNFKLIIIFLKLRK